MGIGPTAVASGNDCLFCYPAGQAPAELHVSLEGIQKGDDWLGFMPPPPNYIFKLLQDPIIACKWTAFAAGFAIFVEHEAAQTVCRFLFQLPNDFYFNGTGAQCDEIIENDIVAPANEIYYGGRAVITYKSGFGEGTMWAPANLVNLDIQESTFFQGGSVSATEKSSRYADKRDATRIYIVTE